jgi:hypothetical protein
MRSCCAFLCLMFALLASPARASDCSQVAASDPADLIKFLKTEASIADPTCVAKAIVRLGDFRTPAGAAVLIGLLDFQRPESVKEKYHLADLHDKFPAVPALFSIGKPAIPALLAKLQTGEMDAVARSNAIRTITAIYRDNPPNAIATFMRAATKATDQGAAVRLESCARDAIAFCGEKWRVKCEEALK